MLIHIRRYIALPLWLKVKMVNWLENFCRHFVQNISLSFFKYSGANISVPNTYFCKVNNRNSRKRCETCSKLTIKTPEQHHFSSLLFFSVAIVDFEQVNVSWVCFCKSDHRVDQASCAFGYQKHPPPPPPPPLFC